jgi:hypothetical protein
LADNSGDPAYHRYVDGLLAEYSNLNFVLVRHPKQIDAIENFNCLIDSARGEFWACLPDDDRYCSNFLERSIGVLDLHPECQFTFADHWIIGPDGTRDRVLSEQTSTRYARTSLREGTYQGEQLFALAMDLSVCLQTTLFRTPVISSLRFVPGILCGDHSLFLRIGASSEQFRAYYIDEKLLEYRFHNAQITTTTSRKELLRSQIASFEDVKDVPLIHRRVFDSKVSTTYLALALLEAESGESAAAREHAVQGLRRSPGLRTIFGAALVTAAPFMVKKLRAFRNLLRGANQSPV